MPELPDFDSYSDMFKEFLDKADWLTTADLPLVHHARQLCIQLDGKGLDKAALASAYLQAIAHLERRRGKTGPAGGHVPGDLPGQTSIFDELD